MVYLLRFFYAWLLPPGLFILTFLFSYYLFIKTKKNAWLSLTFILIFILSIRVGKDALVKPLEDYYKQPTISELQDAQAIVILGGGIADGVPDFDGEGQIAESASNRYLMGLRLHKALHLPIILSGGNGYSYTTSEAAIAHRTLKACGVDEKFLLREDRSRNTQENAKYTNQICQQYGFRKIILVTTASHLPRAVMLFQREGLDIIPYPSNYRSNKETKITAFALTPSYTYLHISSSAIKEYLGLLALKVGVQ